MSSWHRQFRSALGELQSFVAGHLRWGVLGLIWLALLALPAAGQTQVPTLARGSLCRSLVLCESLLQQAAAFVAAADYQAALQAYEAAYRLSREPQVLTNIGAMQLRLGQREAARQSFVQAYQAAAGDSELKALLKPYLAPLPGTHMAAARMNKEQPAPAPSQPAGAAASLPALQMHTVAAPRPIGAHSLALEIDADVRPTRPWPLWKWALSLGLPLAVVSAGAIGLGIGLGLSGPMTRCGGPSPPIYCQ